jgi:hypothetical protein
VRARAEVTGAMRAVLTNLRTLATNEQGSPPLLKPPPSNRGEAQKSRANRSQSFNDVEKPPRATAGELYRTKQNPPGTVAYSRAGGGSPIGTPNADPAGALARRAREVGQGDAFGIALESASTRTLTVKGAGRSAGSYRCMRQNSVELRDK